MSRGGNTIDRPRHVPLEEVAGRVVLLLAVAKAFDSTAGQVIEVTWRPWNDKTKTAGLEYQGFYVALAKLAAPPEIMTAIYEGHAWAKSGGQLCRLTGLSDSLRLTPL